MIYRVRVRRGGRKRTISKGIVFGKPATQGVNQLKWYVERNNGAHTAQRCGLGESAVQLLRRLPGFLLFRCCGVLTVLLFVSIFLLCVGSVLSARRLRSALGAAAATCAC